MKNIIFIAPPAAGKGTVSELLVKNDNYIKITTSDLLKAEIKACNPLGTKIKEIMASGGLVDDELVVSLLANKIRECKDKLFILDGSPRTMYQASGIVEVFKELNIDNYVAIYLSIDKEEAMKRALGRMTCPKCGRGYNIYSVDFKPAKENYCDDCNELLIKRSDDNEESFNKRFDIYLNDTRKVIDYFKSIDKLIEIDATYGSNEIYKKVKKEIENG